VLADAYQAHTSIAHYDTLRYHPTDPQALQHSEVVYEWRQEKAIQPGAYTLKSYDFEKPATSRLGNLVAKHTMRRSHEQSHYEMYDYPGAFVERDIGESYARTRLEAFQTHYETIQASTTARGLYPGGLVNLTDHPRADQNQGYLITATRHHLITNEYEPVASPTPHPVLVCQFSAINKTQPYRSPPTATKSYVRGPQTAMVVGKAGEEIWTDQYGRVKVHFHWDRLGKEDEKSSCWVRVAQSWAGKRWGTLFTPRIGQEVIVDFLEGDPDQPLITGMVYNAQMMPPYELPAAATRSTLKSSSSKGGEGFNEIRFEDKKSNEQLFIHAEKDQHNRIKNELRQWVGKDHHLWVQKNQFEQIGGDQHTTVKGNRSEKLSSSDSLDVAQNMQCKTGMQYGVEAGTDIHIKAGMNVVIEAGVSITLKAGGGFIVIGPTSVVVSGTPILLNSGGSANSGAGISTTSPTLPLEADEK
jgi:type VI secretion system secreted protein VgrG